MALVRVSLANLATGIPVDADVFKGHFGVISPKSFASGKMRVQALGGGAELTLYGVEFLKRSYDAHSFEIDKDTGKTDARFLVDEACVDSIFTMFEDPQPQMMETDPTREIFEELLKPYPFGTILTEEELATSSVLYIDNMRQPVPESGVGTSPREKEGIRTRRMFRRFDLIVPHETYLSMRESPAIVLLSLDELATTMGGRRKGVTRNGLEMADNLSL